MTTFRGTNLLALDVGLNSTASMLYFYLELGLEGQSSIRWVTPHWGQKAIMGAALGET